MKKFTTLIALLALAVPALAQDYGVVTPSLGALTQITAGATSNLTVNIDCRKQQNVAVKLSFCQPDEGVVYTNLVATFSKSIDGTTFATRDADKLTWTLALQAGGATNMVYATTNFNVGGIGYLRLESLQNREETNYVTNIVFSYAIKTRAP